MEVIDWLLDGDPAIRWQGLRDLVDAPRGEVAAERARVETEGWGARLLALRDRDGQWEGGACFPRRVVDDWRAGIEPDFSDGQPWTSTLPTLMLLRDLGLDPASAAARAVITLVAANCRWEHDDEPFFDGEVEPCINGRTLSIGAYFGAVMLLAKPFAASRSSAEPWSWTAPVSVSLQSSTVARSAVGCAAERRSAARSRARATAAALRCVAPEQGAPAVSAPASECPAWSDVARLPGSETRATRGSERLSFRLH